MTFTKPKRKIKMENEIEINGTTYVRKDSIEKAGIREQ